MTTQAPVDVRAAGPLAAPAHSTAALDALAARTWLTRGATPAHFQ
jgi:hypothetical protein